MYRGKKWFLLISLSLMPILIVTAWVEQGQTQEKYPTRAIEIIVAFSPGGSTDISARLTASYLKKILRVPVNVVNKPGGQTVPACVELYQAAPDGYTLLAETNGSSSMLEIVVKNLPFKIMDRTFIAMTTIAPEVLFVPSKSAIKSLKDLEAEVKQSPENFTFGSLGGANAGDFAIIQFFDAIGVDIFKTKPVIGQGGAQLVTLAAGGHVKLGAATIPSCLPSIRAGLIRALVVTCPNRYPELPDVPTTKELGYPTVTAQHWNGISGPPKVAFEIVDTLNKALEEISRDPEFASKTSSLGALPFYHNSLKTKEFILKETEEARKSWRAK